MKFTCTIVMMLYLSSCSSFTDAVQTGAGAGLGAAAAGGIGYAASNGNLQTTAISGLGGALGGGFLTTLFQSHSKKKKVEEQQQGYDLGRSDTVKSLYWMARNLQKPNEEEERKEVALEVTQEVQEGARINTVSYEETLPVQQL